MAAPNERAAWRPPKMKKSMYWSTSGPNLVLVDRSAQYPPHDSLRVYSGGIKPITHDHVFGTSVNNPTTAALCPPMWILVVCSESCFYTFGRIYWVGWRLWRRWAGLAFLFYLSEQRVPLNYQVEQWDVVGWRRGGAPRD